MFAHSQLTSWHGPISNGLVKIEDFLVQNATLHKLRFINRPAPSPDFKTMQHLEDLSERTSVFDRITALGADTGTKPCRQFSNLIRMEAIIGVY